MRRAAILGLALAAACAPAAAAGTAGGWTRVSDETGSNITYIALHRTGDGVLHAVWDRQNAADPNTADIVHKTVTPGGTVGPLSPIVTWSAVSSPDLAAAPGGGLIALWGGLKNSVESGFATADDSGTAWTEAPTAPIAGNAVYASPVSIENGPDGTVFETWYGTGGTFVHRGTDPASESFNYQQPLGGYAFSAPNLARDGADGTLWLGWPVFSAGANNGAWVAQVDPATGAQLGPATKMPGSSTNFQGSEESTSILGRWAITGRPGRSGVFVAAPAGYPSANRIIFWRVGSPSSITLDTSQQQHRQVAIAADPDGRIIVVWGTDTGDAGKLFARVSDTTVSSFGPAFEIPTLPGATSLWAIAASAQSGGLLDLFANYTEADLQTERYYHTQALPPPVLAKAVNAAVVSGSVLLKLPGSAIFVPLTHDSQIPVGAVVDATKGRVRITEALPGGGTASTDFFEGIFRVTQARSGLATMALLGGNFKLCGKAAGGPTLSKVKVIRHLWGAGSGKFRTKGKYASAAIRGTTWDTIDRCDGTLIRVTKGSVTVRDFGLRKNVVVGAGRSYLAKKR